MKQDAKTGQLPQGVLPELAHDTDPRETREWLVQVPDGTWRTVPIDVVLQRASRRS